MKSRQFEARNAGCDWLPVNAVDIDNEATCMQTELYENAGQRNHTARLPPTKLSVRAQKKKSLSNNCLNILCLG